MVEDTFTPAMLEAVHASYGEQRKYAWLAAMAVVDPEHVRGQYAPPTRRYGEEITFWSAQLQAGVIPQTQDPGSFGREEPVSDVRGTSTYAYLENRAHCVAALRMFGQVELSNALLWGVESVPAVSYPISTDTKEVIPGRPQDYGLSPWPIPALSLGMWCGDVRPFQEAAGVRLATLQGNLEAAEGKAITFISRLMAQKRSRREGQITEAGEACRALPRWPSAVERPDGILRLLLGAYQNPASDDYVAALRALALVGSHTAQIKLAALLSRPPQFAELQKVRGQGIVHVLWALPWAYLEPLLQRHGSELRGLLLNASFEDVTRLRMCLQDHPERARVTHPLDWVPTAHAAWEKTWELVVRQYERYSDLWRAVRGLPILPARKWAAAYLILHPHVSLGDPIKLIAEVDAETCALFDELRSCV